MEDIGMEDDWEVAQRVFILSGVSEGMGVSIGKSDELGLAPPFRGVLYLDTLHDLQLHKPNRIGEAGRVM